MTDKKDEQLTKRVDFVAKDDDEQIATGIVMVPDKVDLQFDFAREDTIRGFADQFGDFMEVGQADGGLMHAVWPSDWMELERNEVLDEATEIGGKEAPAGAWIQSWKFNDDDLWQLVKDDILGAFSIGAIAVQWGGPYEQEELEDVDVPDEIDEEELVWELAGGTIREVSSVDIPAVPDAQVLETKAEAEKRQPITSATAMGSSRKPSNAIQTGRKTTPISSGRPSTVRSTLRGRASQGSSPFRADREGCFQRLPRRRVR